MDSEIWDLLSPRYFSDFFIWLFNGGSWSIVLIILLLFFGTVIWLFRILVPIFKKLGNQSPRGSGWIKEEISNCAPDNRVLYLTIFIFSFVFSSIYLFIHLKIRANPADMLTTGGNLGNLQWLPADEFRALVRFLYQWVLAGYALAVLSLTLGLDSIARWMRNSRPTAPSTEEEFEIVLRAAESTAQATENASRIFQEEIRTVIRAAESTAQATEDASRTSRTTADNIKEVLDATIIVPFQNAVVALSKPAYSLKIHHSIGGEPRPDPLEERILRSDQVIRWGTANDLTYPELAASSSAASSSAASPPVVRFENITGKLLITAQANPDITKLEYRKKSHYKKWYALKSPYELKEEWLELRIEKKPTIYYHCICERYVKL